MISNGPTPFGGGMVASALSTSTRFCTPRRWAFSRVSPQRPSDRSAREHSGVLDLVRRCDADAARAAAQVENARRNARLRLLDGQLAQLFRVRARNEHGFVYAEGQSVEIPLAQNIRERLAAEHAVAQQTRVIHGRVVEIGVRQPTVWFLSARHASAVSSRAVIEGCGSPPSRSR